MAKNNTQSGFTKQQDERLRNALPEQRAALEKEFNTINSAKWMTAAERLAQSRAPQETVVDATPVQQTQWSVAWQTKVFTPSWQQTDTSVFTQAPTRAMFNTDDDFIRASQQFSDTWSFDFSQSSFEWAEKNGITPTEQQQQAKEVQDEVVEETKQPDTATKGLAKESIEAPSETTTAKEPSPEEVTKVTGVSEERQSEIRNNIREFIKAAQPTTVQEVRDFAQIDSKPEWEQAIVSQAISEFFPTTEKDILTRLESWDTVPNELLRTDQWQSALARYNTRTALDGLNWTDLFNYALTNSKDKNVKSYLWELAIRNPQKYQEYITAANNIGLADSINQFSDIAFNAAETPSRIDATRSLTSQLTWDSVIDKYFKQLISPQSEFDFEEIPEDLTQSLRQSNSELTGLDEQYENLQQEMNNLEMDVIEEFSWTWASKWYIQAKIRDRAKGIQREMNSLNIRRNAVVADISNSQSQINTILQQNEQERKRFESDRAFGLQALNFYAWEQRANQEVLRKEAEKIKEENKARNQIITNSPAIVARIDQDVNGWLNKPQQWKQRAIDLAKTWMSEAAIESVLRWEISYARRAAWEEAFIKSEDLKDRYVTVPKSSYVFDRQTNSFISPTWLDVETVDQKNVNTWAQAILAWEASISNIPDNLRTSVIGQVQNYRENWYKPEYQTLTSNQLDAANNIWKQLEKDPIYSRMVEAWAGMNNIMAIFKDANDPELASKIPGFRDIAAINAFQRIVDPGVSVREWDVDLLQSAISLKQRWTPEFIKVQTTEWAKLPNDLRKEMIKTAIDIYNAQQAYYNEKVLPKYMRKADAANIPVDLIAEPFFKIDSQWSEVKSGLSIPWNSPQEIRTVLPEFQLDIWGTRYNNPTWMKVTDRKSKLLDQAWVKYAKGWEVWDTTGWTYYVFPSGAEWRKAQNSLWSADDFWSLDLYWALIDWKWVSKNNPELSQEAADAYAADILAWAFWPEFNEYAGKSYFELTEWEKENLILAQLQRENPVAYKSYIEKYYGIK